MVSSMVSSTISATLSSVDHDVLMFDGEHELINTDAVEDDDALEKVLGKLMYFVNVDAVSNNVPSDGVHELINTDAVEDVDVLEKVLGKLV
eukprot:6475602-Amphidinium_carterae.1